MTKNEKEEVIKNMGLGNKWLNRLKYLMRDFANFMIMVCAVIILLVMAKIGFIASLMFLLECFVVYIVSNTLYILLRVIIRKIIKLRR